MHRHTSHENDEIRTNKWPQFVEDDVQHDNIYVINQFICIWCRNSLKSQRCLTRHVQMVCSCMTSHNIYKHTAIGEKSDFSTHSIHYNTCHEVIWWPLQNKWSICQCSSNTRSNNMKYCLACLVSCNSIL